MNIVEIEQALTAYFASRLDLLVDRNIFRGAIPAGVASGVAVRLGQCQNDVIPSTRNWNLQIIGKFDTRDEAALLNDRIIDIVPTYEVEASGLPIAAIVPTGWGDPYTAADDGKSKHYVSVNLLISFRKEL